MYGIFSHGGGPSNRSCHTGGASTQACYSHGRPPTPLFTREALPPATICIPNKPRAPLGSHGKTNDAFSFGFVQQSYLHRVTMQISLSNGINGASAPLNIYVLWSGCPPVSPLIGLAGVVSLCRPAWRAPSLCLVPFCAGVFCVSVSVLPGLAASFLAGTRLLVSAPLLFSVSLALPVSRSLCRHVYGSPSRFLRDSGGLFLSSCACLFLSVGGVVSGSFCLCGPLACRGLRFWPPPSPCLSVVSWLCLLGCLVLRLALRVGVFLNLSGPLFPCLPFRRCL